MLHRNFKGAKCKTSLKLAVARIKLLRNKREVQIKQMKRDLAQLLESGQDRTARIRVEHVVREEKTMTAYDLIEIYCELIVARLPIIESQKACPIDLKEAISSIIFAAPRCSDVPELQDVRKHFMGKYGKDFITASLELRPDCGVSRMIIEKLSAKAPDIETKVNILAAVAQEHNVKWDPTSFKESELKPREDLLNLPSVTARTNEIRADPVTVQPPVTHGRKDESPLNFVKNATGLSWSSHTSDHRNTTGPTATSHVSLNETRDSGSSTEQRDFGRPSSKNERGASSDRQEWKMEFKDATAAAQAAAESAERASRAARAAAEFSIQGNMARKYSAELHEFYQEDARFKEDVDLSKMVDRSLKSSSHRNDPGLHNQQTHGAQKDGRGEASESILNSNGINKRRPSNSSSSGTSRENVEDDVSDGKKCSSPVEADNAKWQTGRREEVHFVGQSSIKKQLSQSEFNPENYQWEDRNTKYTNSGEESIRKQTSESASSNSSSPSYENDVIADPDLQNYGNDGGEYSFIGSDQGNVRRETGQPSLNHHHDVVFDEYGSDDDTANLDAADGHTMHRFGTPSPGKNSSYISENLDTRSPGRHESGSFGDKYNANSCVVTRTHSSEFSEDLKERIVSPHSGDLAPATFDDSDGINSESEEEPDNVKLNQRVSGGTSRLQNTFTRSPESAETISAHGLTMSSQKNAAIGIGKKPWLDSSSESEPDDAYVQRNSEDKLNISGKPFQKYGLDKSHQKHPSRAQVDPFNYLVDDLDEESSYIPVVEKKRQPIQSSRLSLEKEDKSGDSSVAPGSPGTVKNSESNYLNSKSGKELKFGRLTGGFRNKGYTQPPYYQGRSVDTRLVGHKEADDTSSITEQPITSSKVRDSMHSEAQFREIHNQRPHHTKRSSNILRQVSDSDSDNETEVYPYQTAGSQSYMDGGRPHRTRDSPAPSQASSVSVSTSASKVPVSSNEKKISRQSPDASEAIPKQQSRTVSTGSRTSVLKSNSVEHRSSPKKGTGGGEYPKLARGTISGEQQSPKPGRQTEIIRSDGGLKPSPSISATEQSSNPPPIKTSTDSPRVSSLSGGTASRENSLKKAGHVHPKLPDYDTLAAHFESLRSNR